MNYLNNEYDIIVVGAGHAGCEASIACAKSGAKVLLATLDVNNSNIKNNNNKQPEIYS